MTSARLFALTLVAMATLPLLTGCPKTGSGSSSGAQEPNAWIVFELAQRGTQNDVEATVWAKDMPDHFETVLAGGDVNTQTRFFGLGRTEDGYMVPFRSGVSLELQIWAPGHEMITHMLKLKKGENLISRELPTATVEDSDVPEKIRTEVLQSLPSQGPKSGS